MFIKPKWVACHRLISDGSGVKKSAWLKQRNDCASAVDMRGCVVQSYRTRIARLEGS